MLICERCKSVRVIIKSNSGAKHCIDCGYTVVDGKPTKITNAEAIRALSDEELATFLVNFKNTFGTEHEGEMSCLDWLQSEVEE